MTGRDNLPPNLALIRSKVRQAVGINQQQAVIGDGNGTVRIDAEPGYVWVRVQQGNGLSQPVKALANAVMSYYEGADCYVANIGQQLGVVRARLTNEQSPLVWSYIDSDLNIAAAASSFSIQNITQSYDVWRLTMFLRGSNASSFVNPYVRLNNNTTASNYAAQHLFGNNTTVTAARDTTNATVLNWFAPAASAGVTTLFPATTLLLYNVINTNSYTSAEFYSNYQAASLSPISAIGGGIFQNTSAINRIDIVPSAGNWLAGSGWILEGLVH